jgi:hypothetical protein
LNPQDGVVMVRKISNGTPSIAHFQPHRHPIVALSFNSSQTMLFTASSKGTSIYAWSLLHSFGSKQQPTCVMKFARGFTSAFITHLQISNDSQWMSCTTSRGTTHVYKTEEYSNRTLYPCARINSRNTIQMVRTMLSVESNQESLGSSPLYVKPSTSVDNATSDLGYDDIFLDTMKNVPMATFLPLKWVKIKNSVNSELYLKRLPLLTWNPFGKISLIYIDITQQLDPNNNLKNGFKYSISCVSEWTVCRSLEWQEVSSQVVISFT